MNDAATNYSKSFKMTTADSKQLHTLLLLHEGSEALGTLRDSGTGVNIYQIKRRYVLKELIVTVTTVGTSYLKEVQEQKVRRILAAMGEELKQRREHCSMRSFVRCSIPHIATVIQIMHTKVQVGKTKGRGQLGTSHR
jgi:hypothetical protein